jgi:hypothetical protein
MKAKPIRLCIECGKQHDTGVENKLTGEFNRVDKCIYCLMSKCSFKFESRQITLDDLKPMNYDQMQYEFGKIVCKILKAEYSTNGIEDLQKTESQDIEEIQSALSKPLKDMIDKHGKDKVKHALDYVL